MGLVVGLHCTRLVNINLAAFDFTEGERGNHCCLGI